MKKSLLILLCVPLIGFGQKTGCTDSASVEYDSNAIVDDGSCSYDIWDLFYSDDSNTVYLDSSRTQKVTGWIEYNPKGSVGSSIQVIDGKSASKTLLSEWLDDPGSELLTTIMYILIVLGPIIATLLLIALIFLGCLSSYRVIKHFFSKNYASKTAVLWILIAFSFAAGGVVFGSIIVCIFIILWIYLGIKKKYFKR